MKCVFRTPGERHPAARELDLDQRVGRQVEPEPAVLLRDRHAEQAELLHLLDERRRELVRVLVLGRDRDRPPARPTRGSSRRSRCSSRRRHAATGCRASESTARRRPAPRARGSPPRAPRRDSPSASAAFSRNFSRTCVGAHRVLGRAELVREVGLERAPVAQSDPHAARERRRVATRTPSSRSAPCARARARAGRRAPRPCSVVSADAAVHEHRRGRVLEAELALVVACAARSSRRPARARARRRPRGS